MDKQLTIGVHILQIGLNFSQVKKICKSAESLGFDFISLMDHFRPFFPPKYRYLLECWECWTTLGALATETRKIRIGSLVTCASYRNPALLAKIAACLDHISGGRLRFGIGAGWYKEEFEEYGIPFGKPKERIGRLEEAIQIIKKMWLEKEATFSGKYYKVANAVCYPKPVQKPYPPIIIGGGGEKFTLKVVAKLADAWNYSGSLEDHTKKLEILKKHCKEVNRDFKELKLSRMAWVILSSDRKRIASSLPYHPDNLDQFINRHIIGTPNKCIKNMQRFIDIGVTDFELVFPDTFFNCRDASSLPNLETIKLFAENVLSEFK